MTPRKVKKLQKAVVRYQEKMDKLVDNLAKDFEGKTFNKKTLKQISKRTGESISVSVLSQKHNTAFYVEDGGYKEFVEEVGKNTVLKIEEVYLQDIVLEGLWELPKVYIVIFVEEEKEYDFTKDF